jgi:hypothetical protein
MTTTTTRGRVPSAISYLLMLGVAVLGIASILATSNPAAPGGSGGNGYYYANWDCNNVSGCITDLGHDLGSAGPFCTSSSCSSWRQSYISSATCDPAAKHPIYYSASSGCT